MSITSGISWFFDSGCCTHMTTDSSIFSFKKHVPYTYPINIVDGFQLHVNHIWSASISNLSLPATSHVPKLIMNLIFVGQLCDLGLNVIFFSSGCQVQDTQT